MTIPTKRTIKTRRIKNVALAATVLMLGCSLPVGGAEPAPTTPLTIEKTIQLVRQQHPSLKAAAEDIAAAEARVTQSRSSYYPQLSAGAGYTALNPISEASFGGGASIKFMPNDNYDAKVSAKATLLDFGRRSGSVELALTGKTVAEEQLEFSQRELSWQTVQLFYGTLFLRESIKVETTEITALNKALDYTKKRYQAGVATPFDIFSTEVRIAAARNRQLDLEHELRRNELALRRLTGIAESVPLALEGSFALAPNVERAEFALVAEAMAQRIELKLSRQHETAARQQNALAKKEGLPMLTGALSYGITNGFQPDIYQMRNNVAANLHLEVPLFSGFRTSAKQQENAAQLRAAALRSIDAEQQIKNDVDETMHALHTASEKSITTEVQVKQAELATKHARSRYENGMATTLDLLDTEASLAQAKLAQLQAAYACVINSYKLKRATGAIFWKDETPRDERQP
jgi:outer membrane protein